MDINAKRQHYSLHAGAVYRIDGPSQGPYRADDPATLVYPATCIGEHVGGDAVLIRYRLRKDQETLVPGVFYLCRKLETPTRVYGDDDQDDRGMAFTDVAFELVPVAPLTPTQVGAAWTDKGDVLSQVGATPDGQYIVRRDKYAPFVVNVRREEWRDEDGNLLDAIDHEEKVAPILDGPAGWRETTYYLSARAVVGEGVNAHFEWDGALDGSDPDCQATLDAWLNGEIYYG